MSHCAVCRHKFRHCIEKFLIETIYPAIWIAIFFRVPEQDVEFHRDHCMKETYP